MKKVIQSARSKRNWVKVFSVGAVFIMCLLNLQVSFTGNPDNGQALNVSSLKATAQTYSGEYSVGANHGTCRCHTWGTNSCM